MAIVFDVWSEHPGTSGVVAINWNHTVAAGTGRILIVQTGAFDNALRTVASVTFGGVALTYLVGSRLTIGDTDSEIWYLLDPVVGLGNIVVTWNAAPVKGQGAGARSYQGIDIDDPLGVIATTTGAGNLNVNVNSEDDELVVDFYLQGSTIAITHTKGAGQTFRGDFSTSRFDKGSTSEEAGAALVNMAWTSTSVNGATLAAIPLKPATLLAIRAIEYTIDAWDIEQRIFDSAGHEVPRYKIKPNKWCRIVGLESTTAEVYISNYNDPTLVYFESVTYDGEGDQVQIIANRGDLPEVMLARLTSGSTG